MITADVRAAYDAQVRRAAAPGEPGAVVEASGGVLRTIAPPGAGPSRVTWSDLGAASADAAIAAQVAFFAARGEPFEWTLFSDDRPADLGSRLAAAGLAPGETELVMAAETAGVAARTAGAGAGLPDGVQLAELHGPDGVAVLAGVHERVFGTDGSRLRAVLTAMLAQWPGAVAMVAALAGDEPVAAARAEFLPGRDFAGLWGGGTAAAWRHRGLYRALTGWRARRAAERGYRYLQVDALPPSQPILARLGFAAFASATPYIWEPGAGPPAGGHEWSS